MIRKLFYNFIAKRMGYVQDLSDEAAEQRLRKILQHAFDNVPYYKELFLKNAIVENGEVIMERFNKIPFLDKNILREKSQELIAGNINKKTTYWNTSGGSTGEPVKFLQDKNYLRVSRAITYEQKTRTGYRFGDRMIKLWGDDKEILLGSRTFKSKIINCVKNLKFLNSFSMTTENMREYISVINETKPKLVVAYAQALYELCRFSEENNFKITGAQAIMTSAGTLHPFMREVIERVCGVKVFNRYGTREVGNIACECEKHGGLHVAQEGVYLEIVDEKGNPCPAGMEGEIIITSLINFSMPLIRYRIGDFGILSEKDCSCGRKGLLLKNVTGRITDAFKTKDGKVVPAEYFIHFIGVVLNKGSIKKFQVIQHDFNSIEVKLVPTNLFNESDNREIIEKIRIVMGSSCNVEITKVEDVLPLKSGKYRYTISEI